MPVDRKSSGDSSDFVNSRPAGKVRDGCNIRIRCNLNRCGKFFTSKHVLVWHKRAVHTGRKCTVVQFVGKYSQDMTTYRDINVTYMKMTNMFVLSVAKNLQEKTIFGVMRRSTRKRLAKGKLREAGKRKMSRRPVETKRKRVDDAPSTPSAEPESQAPDESIQQQEAPTAPSVEPTSQEQK